MLRGASSCVGLATRRFGARSGHREAASTRFPVRTSRTVRPRAAMSQVLGGWLSTLMACPAAARCAPYTVPITPAPTISIRITLPLRRHCQRRCSGPGDQPCPGALQPPGENTEEPLGELVAEGRVRRAPRPDGGGVELEGSQRPGAYRAERPPVGREQPGTAEQLAHADGLDGDPSFSRHVHVQGDITGLDQPELACEPAVLEDPVPGREKHVCADLGERVQVAGRHPAQERVRGERRPGDLGHTTAPPSEKLVPHQVQRATKAARLPGPKGPPLGTSGHNATRGAAEDSLQGRTKVLVRGDPLPCLRSPVVPQG